MKLQEYDENVLCRQIKEPVEIYGGFTKYLFNMKDIINTITGRYIIGINEERVVCLECGEYEDITLTFGKNLIIECSCGNKWVMK